MQGDRGKPVPLTGSSYADADLFDADRHDVNGVSTYTSPTVETVGLPSLEGVALTADSEGDVTFGLELSSYSTIQISTLTAPNRAVTDVYH